MPKHLNFSKETKKYELVNKTDDMCSLLWLNNQVSSVNTVSEWKGAVCQGMDHEQVSSYHGVIYVTYQTRQGNVGREMRRHFSVQLFSGRTRVTKVTCAQSIRWHNGHSQHFICTQYSISQLTFENFEQPRINKTKKEMESFWTC